MAEAKKAEGNKEYAQKHYEAAVKLYSEAIGRILLWKHLDSITANIVHITWSELYEY